MVGDGRDEAAWPFQPCWSQLLSPCTLGHALGLVPVAFVLGQVQPAATAQEVEVQVHPEVLLARRAQAVGGAVEDHADVAGEPVLGQQVLGRQVRVAVVGLAPAADLRSPSPTVNSGWASLRKRGSRSIMCGPMDMELPWVLARTKYRSPSLLSTMSRMTPSRNCGKYRRWQLTMISMPVRRWTSSSATISEGRTAIGFSTMAALTRHWPPARSPARGGRVGHDMHHVRLALSSASSTP